MGGSLRRSSGPSGGVVGPRIAGVIAACIAGVIVIGVVFSDVIGACIAGVITDIVGSRVVTGVVFSGVFFAGVVFSGVQIIAARVDGDRIPPGRFAVADAIEELLRANYLSLGAVLAGAGGIVVDFVAVDFGIAAHGTGDEGDTEGDNGEDGDRSHGSVWGHWLSIIRGWIVL